MPYLSLYYRYFEHVEQNKNITGVFRESQSDLKQSQCAQYISYLISRLP